MKIPQISKAHFARISLFCFTMILVPVLSHARDVSFTWTATPEPVTGYKLYYKTGTGTTVPYNGTGLIQGDSPILPGKVTTYTVTGLSPDETYYFAISAYSGTGESEYSAIVTIQPEGAEAPTILNISIK